MTVAEEMLRTNPKDLGGIDQQKLIACIEACLECAQACTACADLCETTARVLSRHTGYHANLTRATLDACRTACASCADECERHAGMNEHCRVCAEACRRCEEACAALLGAL